MKYHTINELRNFNFKEAYIAQICAVSGMFEIVFDNVTILPENSCNRDIREMRANEFVLKISDPVIEAFVGEVYSVEQEKGCYIISVDTEDHTFLLRVSGSGDTEEWDRFLNK